MLLKIIGVDTPHEKGKFCRKITRPYYAIHYFSTPFLYLRDGQFYEGKMGDVLINTPNCPVYHGPLPESKEGFVNDWLYIQGDDFEELLNKYPLPLNEAFSIDEHQTFHKYATRLRMEWWARGTLGAKDMINSIITEMIVSTYRNYVKVISFNERCDKIDMVRRKVFENPAKNWTLQEMTEMCGYSTSRFSELYYKRYGCSPINDVINQRIMLAKDLLISNQMSVSQIAESCGFSTVNYFSRCFKKGTGHTPREYIRLFGND